MSKPQPSPEVLRSIDAHRLSLGTALGAMLLGGCLASNVGADTTVVVLSSESSAAEESGESTRGGIMTTTEDPESTSEPGETSEGSSVGDSGDDTTGAVPPDCGDGTLQVGEECDYGAENADDGKCTSKCKMATCGDKLVQKDVEACDDGVNDGAYGGCEPDCTALAGHCGDFTLQEEEECDFADPKTGCLKDTCTLAQSCKQIKDVYGADVLDGIYTIAPKGAPIKVVCEMDADGGGYTYFKIDKGAALMTAKEAEAQCASYGLHLLAPRSKDHLASAVLAAKSAALDPVGGGTTKGSMDYLKILGIYPKTMGESCPGEAFNSVACPEWTAPGGVFWINNKPFPEVPFASEPGTKTCVECSLVYYWSAQGVLDGYESTFNNNLGGQSSLVMCDYGDKLPPM